MPQLFMTKQQIVDGPPLTSWPVPPPGSGHKQSASSSDVAKLLTKIEWSAGESTCPCCGQVSFRRHESGCWLKNILALCWAEHPGRFDQSWLTPVERGTSPLPEDGK